MTAPLLVISPHPDDAILSVGAAIAAACDVGRRVLVVDVCRPAEDAARREEEERAALAELGAELLWLDLPEAPARLARYRRPTGLFSPPAEEDPIGPAFATALRFLHRNHPDAEMWAPAGVGAHVDHVAVARVCSSGPFRCQSFYEDLPYAATRPPGPADRGSVLDVTPWRERKHRAIQALVQPIAFFAARGLPLSEVVLTHGDSLLPGRFGERLFHSDRTRGVP